MGKITGSGSAYSHNWRKIGFDHYRLSWTFDVKLQGSRLRWPRTMTRDTDEAGAIRFAKKWDLEAPNYKCGSLMTESVASKVIPINPETIATD